MHQHSASRGIWRIAMVVVTALGLGPETRPKRRHRWWSHPVTDKDWAYIARYHRIMAALREQREQADTDTSHR